jgi:adenylate cyclase
VGIGTYRDTILRNPLLRAQNQIERQQSTTVKLGSLFDKFVSPEVKRRLMDRATVRSVIAGETVDISCLFCDIRGFTTRSESIGPEELFAELNSYFSEVVDAVQGHDGTVDKFIGDAVMVLFGAPVAQSDHALRAVACAITIIQRVEAFNAARSGHAPIQVGIGINSGRAVAGCLGTETRFAYTALGDTVNIAARLESRAAPGQILISGATAVLLSNSFELNSIGSLELKGKAVKVEAFEVLRMH